MKSLVASSLLAVVLAAPAVLACEGHGAQTASSTIASNGDKAAPAQKSETVAVTPPVAPAVAQPVAPAAEVTFKQVSVDDVEKSMAALKKDKKPFAVFDANGKATRESQGIIPTAILLPSSSEYDLALLPTDKATPVVFYCANEKCTASHTAAKRAIKSGFNDVAVLGVGIQGWVKAGKAVDKKPVG
ncbi:MAG: rhodanese-like domain-containing protein [Deltaproteobacteria bacterium]|nr:rhodanese-like domain-containing protein [Deltaproteobacteria bacterium]